ncbi:MAG: tetratricopeptide repeat protein [Acidobacteria bacterium]|nr:tetratricopeptide repeat protein [Acidobacteriota bacterium]
MYKSLVSPHTLFAVILLLLCAGDAGAQLRPVPGGDRNGDPRVALSQPAHSPRDHRAIAGGDWTTDAQLQGGLMLSRGRSALRGTPPDHARAERWFNSAARVNPREPRAFEGLGDTYEAQGMYGEAARAFEQAVDLKPKRAEWQYKLGALYHRLGRGDDARAKILTLRRLKKKQLAARLEALLAS